jgi:transcriptional regulator with XRE-family HTH domain
MNKNLFLNALKHAMDKNGHTQLSLAKELKIEQARISKILSGQFSRGGKIVNILLKYSKYDEYVETRKLTGEIDKAVAEIWDGSLQMELQIANIIRRIGPALIPQPPAQ